MSTVAAPYPNYNADILRGIITARNEDLETLKSQHKGFVNRIMELEIRSGVIGTIPVDPERIRNKSSKVYREAFEAGFRGWPNTPPSNWRWRDPYKEGYAAGNKLALERFEKAKQYR